MTTFAKLIVTGLVVSALMVAGGALLASGWYHDDACHIAEWKCEAGTLGLASAVVGIYLGGATLLAAAIGFTVRRIRSHRSSRP